MMHIKTSGGDVAESLMQQGFQRYPKMHVDGRVTKRIDALSDVIKNIHNKKSKIILHFLLTE